MKETFAGKFIVLDGPDGCGKSTQVELLVQWLKKNDVPTVSFRDPGTTVIGEKIREILLSPEHELMDTRTELLLYMAARAQLWAEDIRPALQKGCCVVLDRWLSSTCAYQGYAGELGTERIVKIAADSLERTWPDFTVMLDVDTKAAEKRLDRQLDRMELKGRAYHSKVRQGFIELSKNEIENSVVIDASADIETVHDNVVKAVQSFFKDGRADVTDNSARQADC